ncbi:hypothetical protein PoHVEF18_009326 [Penicillium ochrochloron]
MAEDINTSDTFKVLTASDNMGGSCDSKKAAVDAMVPEVQQLIKAATDSIDTILTDPSGLGSWTPSKRSERLRLLLLARRFFGTKFNAVNLKVDSSTKGTLNTVKGRFNQITTQINAKDKKWRFGCDDSWLQYITKLQSEYASLPVGTPVKEVPGLGSGVNEWAFFDIGGPKLRPSKNKDDFDTQQTWYMSQARGWFDTGPCSGIKKNTPNAVYPDAQTVKEQLIIYFCPRVWDDIGTRLKDDVRNYKSATIATDGTQYLDSYMTPGATLLHEMTHQVFDSEDGPPKGLGYFFVNVVKGKDNPDQATMNADSYPYFAVAAYLSQVEWHSGVARKIGEREKDIHT